MLALHALALFLLQFLLQIVLDLEVRPYQSFHFILGPARTSICMTSSSICLCAHPDHLPLFAAHFRAHEHRISDLIPPLFEKAHPLGVLFLGQGTVVPELLSDCEEVDLCWYTSVCYKNQPPNLMLQVKGCGG
jgi:hypothetical protein